MERKECIMGSAGNRKERVMEASGNRDGTVCSEAETAANGKGR